MLLALAYLGDDLRRNDIGVVKSACVLQGHKYTFVLHALSLDTTLMSDSSWLIPVFTFLFFLYILLLAPVFISLIFLIGSVRVLMVSEEGRDWRVYPGAAVHLGRLKKKMVSMVYDLSG